jgi:hypothetical protein
VPCWRLARAFQESFRTCDVGHRGTPFIVNYFCVSRPIDIFWTRYTWSSTEPERGRARSHGVQGGLEAKSPEPFYWQSEGWPGWRYWQRLRVSLLAHCFSISGSVSKQWKGWPKGNQ